MTGSADTSSTSRPDTYTAFRGDQMLATGALPVVAGAVKAAVEAGTNALVVVVHDVTSQVVDLDLRGSVDDVLTRLPSAVGHTADVHAKATRGRPRLGVVAREVTLLPRHWEWLAEQPGGASVTLRRLVEQARAAGGGAARLRLAQESAYRFMSATLGDHPGFEEATRALFAGDAARYNEFAQRWPIDLRRHAQRLADTVFRERDAHA